MGRVSEETELTRARDQVLYFRGMLDQKGEYCSMKKVYYTRKLAEAEESLGVKKLEYVLNKAKQNLPINNQEES